MSASLPVEGGQLQAEPPVIRIKLVDLAAEQFDLGIHDTGRGPAGDALSERIIGRVLARPAGVWCRTYPSGSRRKRPGTLSYFGDPLPRA